MSYWGFGRYPQYVPVARKKEIAERKLKQLQKVNPNLQPVRLNGKALASTWWGQEWNKNLERYADYHNRIERGRSYVRDGAVMDLQIEPGQITALVQGTAGKPYDIRITINPLGKRSWKAIKTAVAGKLDSLQELLAGKFPRRLSDIFTARDHGLFPSPKEMTFSCSCPDWANMCKHVAAALYGVGARLDQQPELFFTLRKIVMEDLIEEAIKDSAGELLRESRPQGSRVLTDTNLSALFGIDLATDDAPELFKPEAQTSIPFNTEPPPVAEQALAKQPATFTMPIDRVRQVLAGTPEQAITINGVVEKTGLRYSQVSHLIYLMKQRGEVQILEGEKLLSLKPWTAPC